MAALLGRLLFEVSSTDPMIYATVAGGFLIVALTASLIPALRALRIGAAEALNA
jgi:ABC-type lipoprotein release transport system permease subunit